MKRHLNRALAAAAALALLAGVSGCFNPFRPQVASEQAYVAPPPVPNSATNVVLLFQWCWQNRDISRYREIFTADYQFAFATTDSAGSPYRNEPWRRQDELASAEHLFIGGSASEAPASSITLTFSPDPPIPERDFRPGKTYPWHQKLDVQVTLSVNKTDGTGFQVGGRAVFYVVRGDSASIPDDLAQQPDANRWYIERWEDQTNTGPGAFALAPAGAGTTALRPASRAGVATNYDRVSWGFLKDYYLRR